MKLNNNATIIIGNTNSGKSYILNDLRNYKLGNLISFENVKYPIVNYKVFPFLKCFGNKKINEGNKLIDFYFPNIKRENILEPYSKGVLKLFNLGDYIEMFLKHKNKITLIIDSIETDLDVNIQSTLIEKINEYYGDELQLVCSTNSPSIFLEGWENNIIYAKDIMKTNRIIF